MAAFREIRGVHGMIFWAVDSPPCGESIGLMVAMISPHGRRAHPEGSCDRAARGRSTLFDELHADSTGALPSDATMPPQIVSRNLQLKTIGKPDRTADDQTGAFVGKISCGAI